MSGLASVGLLAPDLLPHGGIQTAMWRLLDVVKQLAAQRGDPICHLWSLNDPLHALQRDPRLGDEVLCYGAHGRKTALIRRMLKDRTPIDDLIVGHLSLAPLARALQLAGSVERYHVLLHGKEAWKQLDVLDRIAVSQADSIVSWAAYTASLCQKINHLPGNKLHVIPLCITDAATRPDPGFQLEGGFKILTVGRQHQSERPKGYDTLIDAMAMLRQRGVDAHLHLVGSGNDQPRMQVRAARTGVGSAIHFHGSIPDAALQAAYQQCDVFALPSRKEGFGLVFLEAMRYGKPCIGATDGAIPEVIAHGDTGLLVPYGNSEAMVETLHRLATTPDLLQRMGTRALAAVAGQFSVGRFEQRWLDLLQADPMDPNSILPVYRAKPTHVETALDRRAA